MSKSVGNLPFRRDHGLGALALRTRGIGELGAKARWCWGLSAQGIGDPEEGWGPWVPAVQCQSVHPKVS